CQSDGIFVEWTTASEKNSDYFRIEYSEDTREWKPLENHQAFGTTNTQQDYQLMLENAPQNGYYRLSEVDIDGTITSYDPENINCQVDESKTEFLLSPNPADIQTRLTAFNSSAEFYNVSISNVNGAEMNTFRWENPAETPLKVNTKNMDPGMYSLRIYNNSELQYLKLIVK
ncbi:MAG: T9SS type A sorting domain-containing protein, partial [Bacteroidales bacterium]